MFAITSPKQLTTFVKDNEKNKKVLEKCREMLRGRNTEVSHHVLKNIEEANQFKKNEQARLLQFSEAACNRQLLVYQKKLDIEDKRREDTK